MKTMSEEVTPAQAAKLAEHARQADLSAQSAQLCLQGGRETIVGKTPLEHVREMRQHLEPVARTLSRYAHEGAKPTAEDRFDLSDLRALDTPESRDLLATLEKALALAERVDAQRGDAVDAELCQPGEPRGLDYAESVYALVVRLRREVNGPKGLGGLE